MIKQVFILILILLPVSSWGQFDNSTLNLGPDMENPVVYSNGIFRYFIESDHQLRYGDPEKALMVIDLALIENPFFAEAYIKRARILMQMGRNVEARQDIQSAQKINPFVTALLLDNSKSTRRSLVQVTPLKLEASNYGDFLNPIRKSIELKLNGDYLNAKFHLDRVLDEIRQPDPFLLSLNGHIHFLTDNFAEAIQAYTRAIRLAPEDPAHYFNRGLALLFTYNRSAACEDLETSHRLGNAQSETQLKYFCYN